MYVFHGMSLFSKYKGHPIYTRPDYDFLCMCCRMWHIFHLQSPSASKMVRFHYVSAARHTRWFSVTPIHPVFFCIAAICKWFQTALTFIFNSAAIISQFMWRYTLFSRFDPRFQSHLHFRNGMTETCFFCHLVLYSIRPMQFSHIWAECSEFSPFSKIYCIANFLFNNWNWWYHILNCCRPFACLRFPTFFNEHSGAAMRSIIQEIWPSLYLDKSRTNATHWNWTF